VSWANKAGVAESRTNKSNAIVFIEFY